MIQISLERKVEGKKCNPVKLFLNNRRIVQKIAVDFNKFYYEKIITNNHQIKELHIFYALWQVFDEKAKW